MTWNDKSGPCPHKQGDRHTCYGNPANGPIICNMVDINQIAEICDRYYRMCELHDLVPEMWSDDPEAACCLEWKYLFLRCAEPNGHLQGAFDIRLYPNDGKDVWRNYSRVRFTFCPFCGERANPSPEKLRELWESKRIRR